MNGVYDEQRRKNGRIKWPQVYIYIYCRIFFFAFKNVELCRRCLNKIYLFKIAVA